MLDLFEQGRKELREYIKMEKDKGKGERPGRVGLDVTDEKIHAMRRK